MNYIRAQTAALLLAPTLVWAETAPALRADAPALKALQPGPQKNDFGVILGILNKDQTATPDDATRSSGRVGIGLGTGLPEGKPLEMSLWSGTGAVAGSIAGPFGAIVGAAVGAVTGLAISVFAVPHNGPEAGDRP